MKNKTRDIIFLSIARGADILTTYLCFKIFSYDLSIEGGIISRIVLSGTGFVGLIILNIITIILLGLGYNRIKKIRVWLVMRTIAVFSLIFATYNLLIYLSVINS